MKLTIGVKSDPVEYRYSYEWLFALLQDQGVRRIQLGSSFEFYLVEDGYFRELKEAARSFDIEIYSCFTAHRELGGCYTGNHYLADVAERAYARYIEIGALVGARYVGSNPGAVYRDQMGKKNEGTRRYLEMMKRLMTVASKNGLSGLTIEPMSCLAEPPTTPQMISSYVESLTAAHELTPESTVPVFLCGDISHGYADEERRIVHDNMALFEYSIPNMVEFHFKNTDDHFESTFGFSRGEQGRVDLHEVKDCIEKNANRWPVNDVTGYLEIGGPKLGRDYSDRLLRQQLVDSLDAIRRVFSSM